MYLTQYGWYRMDARGNKAGVTAEFCPPTEKLAFPLKSPLEKDFAEILAEPLPAVIDVLTQFKTIEDVYDNLADAEVLTITS